MFQHFFIGFSYFIGIMTACFDKIVTVCFDNFHKVLQVWDYQ